MSFRYEDNESSSHGLFTLALGAVAGLAVGVVVAQRFGGLAGISARLRERLSGKGAEIDDEYDIEDYDSDELDDADEEDDDVVLEERVLEAFRNDPILSERAVDIGALGDGIIELSGWVHDESESDHALVLTRGVPDVTTVVNRLELRTEEEQRAANARRYASGDPVLAEARWEGQGVGTGRRRQGTSQEPDRHADPKANLEDRWMNEQHAIEAAAEEIDNIAERRSRTKAPLKGDRTGGSPIAPTGVPKSDHVAEPESREAKEVLREATARETPGKPRAD